MGDAIAGKQLGKKAMVIGAIANSLPDIDIINGLWMPTAKELYEHRGITHSLFFVVLSTIVLALLSQKVWKNKMDFGRWIALWGINIFIHIFIDTFNAYGTAWFEPFSSKRITFNTLFVADPLFSIGPLIAFLLLLFYKNNNPNRRRWIRNGFIASVVYLGFALTSKWIAAKGVKESLQSQQLDYQDYFTTPSPFNTLLWFSVAKDTSGYHVGYRSVFDTRPTPFTYFKQDKALLKEYEKREDIQYLQKFASDFYTVENRNDTMLFNVLRFGQIVGWHDPHEKFMLHYYINYPNDNDLVVQRGRFQRWNRETLASFLQRMAGK